MTAGSLRIYINLRILTAPKKANGAWLLWLDFDEGTDTSTGAFIQVGETDSAVLECEGLLDITGTGSAMALEISAYTPPVIIGSDAGATAVSSLKGKVMSAGASDYGTVGVGLGVEGAANHLNIYIEDQGAANTDSIGVRGVIGIGAPHTS
jgi:hypothetical protein